MSSVIEKGCDENIYKGQKKYCLGKQETFPMAKKETQKSRRKANVLRKTETVQGQQKRTMTGMI